MPSVRLPLSTCVSDTPESSSSRRDSTLAASELSSATLLFEARAAVRASACACTSLKFALRSTARARAATSEEAALLSSEPSTPSICAVISSVSALLPTDAASSSSRVAIAR